MSPLIVFGFECFKGSLVVPQYDSHSLKESYHMGPSKVCAGMVCLSRKESLVAVALLDRCSNVF